MHDCLRRAAYDSIADLAADVKARAARLRLPYDAERVTTALTLVGRTRSLLKGSRDGSHPRRV